jgi:peptidylprolyl isomerase
VHPYKQSIAMGDILTSMTAGERARFWVDTEKMETAGRPLPGNPKGLLCYEVSIDTITKSQHEVPVAPSDVAKPPPGAQKTAKGVFYKVLKAGPSGPHPLPTQMVKVNYTGWQTDGRMFDSSMLKGEPVEFGLNGVIAGWTDGLQVMSVGDKYRFWIPAELAYKGSPSKPQGMLVFDIELLEIKDAKPQKPNPHAGLPGH